MIINGLVCEVHEPRDYVSTIIMTNGFNGSRNTLSRVERAKLLADNGFRVVRWDYRSKTSGGSTKTLTEDLNDLLSLIDYFDCDVGLAGLSWGGQLALQAGARNNKVKAITTRVPVVDLVHFHNHKETRDSPPCATNFFEDLDKYDTYEMASKITAPVLIFSGVRDESCPTEYHKKFFELLPGQKKLIVFDETHGFVKPENVNKVTEEMFAWFKQWL